MPEKNIEKNNISYLIAEQMDPYGGFSMSDNEGEKEDDNKQSENNSEEKLLNIQRAYAIKLIYSKLIALYNEFSNVFPIGDDEIKDKKEEIKRIIDYMEFFMKNVDAYEGKIDEIINLFNDFFKQSLIYFKEKVKEKEKGGNNV